MGLLDKAKEIINNRKKRQAQKDRELWESLGVNYDEMTAKKEPEAPYTPPNLPKGELVSFLENGVLDATSRD